MYTSAVTTALGLSFDREQEGDPIRHPSWPDLPVFKCKTIVRLRDGKAEYSRDERMELQEGHLGGRSGQQSNINTNHATYSYRTRCH